MAPADSLCIPPLVSCDSNGNEMDLIGQQGTPLQTTIIYQCHNI